MIYARGVPATYCGGWEMDRPYDGGSVIHYKGRWYCSRQDANDKSPTSATWADLGSMGAVPTQVAHVWHPRVLQYPMSDDDTPLLSDPVDVCSDCWLDADLKNAFDPRVHLFVIREPESAMGL